MPFFKFFSADWRADPGLRLCSYAARGLWIDMLSLMHESPRRGALLAPDGGPMSAAHLARLTGGTAAEVESLLTEMRSARVFDEADGVILSRRMARDDASYRAQVESGRRGGNPKLRAAEPAADTLNPTLKGGVKAAVGGGLRVPLSSEARSQKSDTPLPPAGGSVTVAPAGEAQPKRRWRASAAGHDPPGFGEFWEAYPKKDGRAEAAKAFAKLAPDAALLTFVLAGVRRYAATVAGKDPAYTKNASGWLNGRRWEDAPGPPAGAAGAPDTARTEANLAASALRAPPAGWRRDAAGTSVPLNTAPVAPGSRRRADLTPAGLSPAPSTPTPQEATDGRLC